MNVALPNISLEFLVFGGLATVAALAAVGVVAFNNAVRSALCLVVNFFFLAFIYFSLNAEFLGISQILVYTGAIMVLFLFVIMLLNLGAPSMLAERRDLKRLIGGVAGLALFVLVFSQVIWPLRHMSIPNANDAYGSPQAIGMTLFTTYAWPFLVASVLLLVGIVGAILLAKRRI
ncbi:MAG: NADH-quinone oxidoreductase subunit J [Fimbriimonadaceae bacterium]